MLSHTYVFVLARYKLCVPLQLLRFPSRPEFESIAQLQLQLLLLRMRSCRPLSSLTCKLLTGAACASAADPIDRELELEPWPVEVTEVNLDD